MKYNIFLRFVLTNLGLQNSFFLFFRTSKIWCRYKNDEPTHFFSVGKSYDISDAVRILQPISSKFLFDYFKPVSVEKVVYLQIYVY